MIRSRFGRPMGMGVDFPSALTVDALQATIDALAGDTQAGIFDMRQATTSGGVSSVPNLLTSSASTLSNPTSWQFPASIDAELGIVSTTNTSFLFAFLSEPSTFDFWTRFTKDAGDVDGYFLDVAGDDSQARYSNSSTYAPPGATFEVDGIVRPAWTDRLAAIDDEQPHTIGVQDIAQTISPLNVFRVSTAPEGLTRWIVLFRGSAVADVAAARAAVKALLLT